MYKSDSYLPEKICFICFNESPLKMMKNVFRLKSLFRSRDIENICVYFLAI